VPDHNTVDALTTPRPCVYHMSTQQPSSCLLSDLRPSLCRTGDQLKRAPQSRWGERRWRRTLVALITVRCL